MVNKKIWWGVLAFVLVFSVFMAGCSTRLGDFTLMSSRNVDLSQLGSYHRTKRTVKGTDSIVKILFYIPVKKTVNLKKALDHALSKVPGAEALVDVRFDYRHLNFLLFQIDGYVVSGTALVNPNLVDASETTPDKPYLVMDIQDGKHFTKRYVSEMEYQILRAKKEVYLKESAE